jgi:hypothetical protein
MLIRKHLKVLLTLVALSLLALHLLFPRVTLDGLAVVLLILCVLPWVTDLVKSVEVPGLKIELRDLQVATEKVVPAAAIDTEKLGGEVSSALVGRATANAQTVDRLRQIAQSDANLALVGAGIEIEKRLRQLAAPFSIDAQARSFGALLRSVETSNLIPGEVLAGIRDLVALRNRAVHGAEVSPEAASWVLENLETVLDRLDQYAQG